MEVIKDISAIIGCILAVSGLILTCFDKVRKWFFNLFNKEKDKDKLDTLIQNVSCLNDRFENIETQLKDHIYNQELDRVKECRKDILCFANRLASGENPTKELTEEVLDDVDQYTKYCKEHPDYQNSKAVISIQAIKDYYSKLL